MLRTLALFIALVLGCFVSGHARTPYAYVINSLGETLSKINLKTGTVTNNILPLGSDVQSYPNQIVVRDTVAYVVCSGTDEIQVINLNTETTVGFISLPTGSNPFQMVIYDVHFAFVTNLLDNSVSTINLDTYAVVDTDPVGVAPEGIAFSYPNVWVVCSNYDYTNFVTNDGYVVIFNPFTDEVVDTIPVGHNPQYIAFDSRYWAHVVSTGNYSTLTGKVYQINPYSHSIRDSVAIGGQPADLTINSDSVVYVAAGGWITNGNIFSYAALSASPLHTAANPLLVSPGCVSVRSFQDRSVFAVSFEDRVDRIDSSGTILNTYNVGDGPIGLDFNYLPGDVNGDFNLNILDLNYMVAWYFGGGPGPVGPVWLANMDGDFDTRILDLNFLVAYFFRAGQKPIAGPPWLLW